MNLKAILLYLSLYTPLISWTQGSSCATAITIPLDGVCRNYTVSSSTGGNLICSSSGTTAITYFSVTTNSAAEDMMLNITGPGGLLLEVAMYGGDCLGATPIGTLLTNDNNACHKPGPGVLPR